MEQQELFAIEEPTSHVKDEDILASVQEGAKKYVEAAIKARDAYEKGEGTASDLMDAQASAAYAIAMTEEPQGSLIDWNAIRKASGEFDVEPDEYCFLKYGEYIKTGEYPYLRNVTDFICKDFPEISDDDREAVYHQTYLCAGKHRKEAREEERRKLLADGWKVLDRENFVEGKMIEVLFTTDGNLGRTTTRDRFKTVKNFKGDFFLMKPRATKKGFCINSRFKDPREGEIFFKEATK